MYEARRCKCEGVCCTGGACVLYKCAMLHMVQCEGDEIGGRDKKQRGMARKSATEDITRIWRQAGRMEVWQDIWLLGAETVAGGGGEYSLLCRLHPC